MREDRELREVKKIITLQAKKLAKVETERDQAAARAEKWLLERNAALTRAEQAEQRCDQLQKELDLLKANK